MTLIEFFNRIFGRQSSGATAKERLRLVLMSDHLSLAPEMIDSMKRDLVDVISRYVEVDREKIDVHFEHQDKALAMLANIPITGVNRNGDGGSTNGHSANGHTANATAEATVQTAPAAQATPATAASPKPATGTRPRRKRRKNTQGGNSQATTSPAPAT